MEKNLEFWKGSSGYSAPGCLGRKGEDGNSIHFSSIDMTSDLVTVKSRISESKSLTNNPEAIENEIYKKYDYILDMYGCLKIITQTGASPQLEDMGNVVFQPEVQGYHIPVNGSGNAVLTFRIGSDLVTVPNSEGKNKYLQRSSSDTIGENRKLWHHRWHGMNLVPKGYEIKPVTTDSLTGRNDDGTTVTFDSSSLIHNISENETYHKICAVLNNGLVIEKVTSPVDNGIFIEKAYIESIDSSLTSLPQYTVFNPGHMSPGDIDETLTTVDVNVKNTLKNNLTTDSSIQMCKMYFEYSHGGELYRMDINVTQ